MIKKVTLSLLMFVAAAATASSQTPSLDPYPPCLPCKGSKIVAQAPKLDPYPPCLPCKGSK